MSRRHPRLPLWRACGAGLGLFAIVMQVLLSGLTAVQAGGAADAVSIICSHDGAASVGDDGRGVGARAQLHFFLDDIFPDRLGRPILGSADPSPSFRR